MFRTDLPDLTLPTEKREIAALVVVLVTATLTISWLTSLLWNYTHGPYRSFDALLIQWDAGWYQSLVEHGYSRHPIEGAGGEANWAFFPLYPFLVWILATISGVSASVSGIITSVVLLSGALFLSYLYVMETRDEETAFTAVLLIALGPYSFYFITMYTESLFVFLIAAGFYSLYHERWVLAGVIGALLSATRGTGVLFGIPLLLAILKSEYSTTETPLSTVMGVITNGKKLFAMVLVPLGLSVFMLHLYFVVGDALAFLHVQHAWGRSFNNPLFVLYWGITSPDFGSIYFTISAIVGICLLLYQLYQRRVIESVFGITLVLVPLASGINSLPRYIIGTLVFIFALNDIANRLGTYKWVVLTVLMQYNVLLLYLWYSASKLVN